MASITFVSVRPPEDCVARKRPFTVTAEPGEQGGGVSESTRTKAPRSIGFALVAMSDFKT